LFAALAAFLEEWLHGSWKDLVSPDGVDNQPNGQISFYLFDLAEERLPDVPSIIVGLASFLLPADALAIAPLPLVSHSLIEYLAVAVFAGMVYWAPSTKVFLRGQKYYLYRPSPYIDVYDDSLCRHWMVADGQPKPAPASAVAEPPAILSGGPPSR